MVNISNGIEELVHGYQNSNTNQILIFGGYVKVRVSLYTQVIHWVNTILKHIDTRVILLRYESSCMVYRPEWYSKQKNCQIPIPILVKKYEILVIDIQMVLKKMMPIQR